MLVQKELKNAYMGSTPVKRATMRVNTSRLPAEYQEVEWILGEGTAQGNRGTYIDTGFKPNNNTRLVVDYEKTNVSSAPGGCYNNPSSVGFIINDQGLQYNNSYENVSGLNINTRLLADLNKNEFYLNGTLLHTFTAGTFQMNINAWLFGWNKNGLGSNNFSGIKMYSAKIYDDGTLVRDFVPCYRKSDTEVGMYDIVNGVFYANPTPNDGTFTKGPDVPSMVEKQVRPSSYEISYDLRGGDLAGLLDAGFTGINTSGTYAFDANGLYQTSSSNDRGTVVYKTIDLTQAKKITLQSLGYWERGSWTNDKYVGIMTAQNTNPGLRGQIRLNTNTGSKDGGIEYYNASGTMILSSITQQDRYSGDTTMTLVVDLENKVIDYNTSGTNVASRTLSITDAIVAEIRNMQYIYLGWNRGYHSFDANERLKEVYIKIE